MTDLIRFAAILHLKNLLLIYIQI